MNILEVKLLCLQKLRKKIWVEKSIIENRIDRVEGERALGKALWSPQKSKSGSDIYKNMRLVKKGDIILHLINNSHFEGISIVENEAIETNGLIETSWPDDAYYVKTKRILQIAYGSL
jgi:5-methylcytosine-specific restriction enzyme B